MSNLTAASGYHAALATPLATGVVYAGTLIDRNVESDMLHHITNGSILDELTRCAQVIQFTKSAKVGPWRPYELNQQLVADQPSSDNICLQICKSAYKSIKVDTDVIRRACDNWSEFEQGFLDDVWYQLSELWHIDALAGMQSQVSARNIGKRAGRYGNIDLGTVGNAVHLTPDNIVDFLSRMRDVLVDAGRWYDGEMFMLVPRSFSNLLLQTMFNKQMCCNTGESVLFKGLKATDILGFTVIETDRLRPVADPATRRLVYPVVAGWNEAYAFTGDITDAEIKPLPNSFGITYNLRTIYGGGVIYPEALAKAYITVSTDGLVTP